MKVYVALILTSIIMSFVTGYFAIQLQENNVATVSDIEQIGEIKIKIYSEISPIAQIDFTKMYSTRDLFQLVYPKFILNIDSENNFDGFISQPCDKKSGNMSRAIYQKEDIWNDFKCRKIIELPKDFFITPPYISYSVRLRSNSYSQIKL